MNEVQAGYEIDATVVLCRVKESGNLGSICRAMKTMGLSRLILADCPEYDETLVRTMAVHSSDVFENAQRYITLEKALVNFSLSAGFTRRTGARRKAVNISARDFAKVAAGFPIPEVSFAQREQSVALVFGNERDGLSDQELALCSLSVYIPSSDSFPSLNVAQAVQIACYELFVSASERKSPGTQPATLDYQAQQDKKATLVESLEPDRALTRKSIEIKIDGIIRAFAQRGAFKQSDDRYLRFFLRDLCERAGVKNSELEYMQRIFFKAFALGSKSKETRRQKEK